VSFDGQPPRTSAAIRGFKLWFGGIFLTIGLVALLIAGVLYLVLGVSLGMGDLVWAFIGAPLGIGVAFTALGGTYVWLGVRQRRTTQRPLQFGTTTEATVTAIEMTGTRVNRRRLWHVLYTYEDMYGAVHTGESRYLSAEEAQSYRLGETVFVRYDLTSPATNAWLGREEWPEQG
jgi:Protein of unknown function (DUF3592)